MAALPFPAEIDVAFTLMLIVDIQRIPHERISQSLAQFHRFEGPGVGDPACSVIDVPLLSLRDETGDKKFQFPGAFEQGFLKLDEE